MVTDERRHLDIRMRPGAAPTTPSSSPSCWRTTPARRSRRTRSTCSPRSRAPSRSSGWTSTRCTPHATRKGIRPLVLGRLERGWVVASETAALDIVGASFIREIEPGELIAVDEDGLRTQQFAEAAPKHCLFEFVYLARPDTIMTGQRVHSVRVEIGRRLAEAFPADADLVIPVPESGTPAAIGYAEESGIPYGMGLVKNSYVGRTFIQP